MAKATRPVTYFLLEYDESVDAAYLRRTTPWTTRSGSTMAVGSTTRPIGR